MKTQYTKSELLVAKTPLRLIILNIFQFLGIVSAALSFPSPETMAVLAMLPDMLSDHIGKIALILIASKPLINVICDILDNGAIDDSIRNENDFRES